MLRLKWPDINGRKHVQHTVRSMGPNRGYGVLDVLRNVYVMTGYSTRKEAWEALEEYERKELSQPPAATT